MDVGVVSKEAFLRCMKEVSSVVDAGLLAWSTTEDLGLPCVAGCKISLSSTVSAS